MNYYNEIDPYAARWLGNLMLAGHIPLGIIDTRSIEDVTPSDLAGFTQCHFFAGIGVWSYALRRAGWPDERPVWTGSCPCQPFSAAGAGLGFDDERHLWPTWQWLIEQCRPAVVLGEQVASRDADPWIDLVCDDLEALGYAFGAVPFPSAGVGAPHIRDRLYWVANADHPGLEGWWQSGCERRDERAAGSSGVAGGLADADSSVTEFSARQGARPGETSSRRPFGQPQRCSEIPGAPAAGPTNGLWRTADWLLCRDGKWRPVEPGTFPLAHGAPSRVGRLRAYGNAIVPQVAAGFIGAYLDCRA